MHRPISNVTLPPLTDYVEVDCAGVRQYMNIKTGALKNDEDGTFELDTPETKEEKYNTLSVQYIRDKYSQNDEYKVLREKLAYDTPEVNTAFNTYNDYVEACKARAYAEVYGGGQTT